MGSNGLAYRLLLLVVLLLLLMLLLLLLPSVKSAIL